MTLEEFQKEMEVLIESFPGTPKGANWPRPRIEAFYNTFSFITADVFRKACVNYIANNFTPPSIDKLMTEVRLIKEISRPAQIFDWCCSWCDQSGTVLAKHGKTGEEVYFACSCEWAVVKRISGITIWRPFLMEKYSPIFWEMSCNGLRYKIPFKNHTPEEAKALSEKSAPQIIKMLKGISDKLPYDPAIRI